ncbi:MAG: alanine--tRNA ligase [Candidatus Thalassarchaeaceae archaeon]|jgi:alanyl-tRNA synthetase|nr:alanine--tRNA ligase [Candidatus Thalassarchaeaceae archaeon]
MTFGEVHIPFWEDSGHHRKTCSVTGLYFWTRDESRTTSGDTNEDPYTFIGSPIIDGFSMRGKDLKDAMRNSFLNYFSSNGHTMVNPYPVIARWRDDIHLTIASIADFQPHVTSGQVPPPANPLCISQPCIRLTDVAAVGRSGRHLTTFEMMAHHAFNRPNDGDVIYWIDQCVRFCDDMLVNTFGINSSEITYVENPWSGGGNAGAALEVIVGGLELATLVFMNLEEHENGDIEIKGLKYREMDLQIIDTGYGLERFCWAAAGTPTIYEAIYPESVSWLKEIIGFESMVNDLKLEVDTSALLSELSRLAGILNIDVGTDVESLYTKLIERLDDLDIKISVSELKRLTEPLSAIYAIPDHMHALCNMLGDGLIPSNNKAGYLARMLARRVCRMKSDLNIDITLLELGKHHMDNHLDMSKFMQTEQGILQLLDLEELRYHEMLRKGESAVKTAFQEIPRDALQVPDEILFRLSEERGITPDMAISISHKLGWDKLSVRVGFSADMADRNAKLTKDAAKVKEKSQILSRSLEKTSQDYYLDTNITDFSANVIHCEKISETNFSSLSFSNEVKEKPTHIVVLDRTLFYPEGGGQLGDQGLFSINSEESIKVLDTKIEEGVIIHFTDGELSTGLINAEVNRIRRTQLMDHHTAVHIVGGAARDILGPHIRQAGSNKGEKYARIDLTHHSRMSRELLDIIEDKANEIIQSNPEIEKIMMSRADADAKFGFDIYQGGPPKHDLIRIIKIGNFDTQACGGTHHDTAGKVGELRIIRSSQVQDGVERLQIVAGDTAREHARQQERILSEASEILGVQSNDLPKAVQKFFEEWKSQQKKISNLEAEIIRLRTSGGGDEAIMRDGIRYVVMESNGDSKQLMKMLSELTRDKSKPTLAIIGSRDGGGKIIVATTENTKASENYNSVEILNSIASHINGGGGGRPTFAQGGGSNPDGIPEALNAARKMLDI